MASAVPYPYQRRSTKVTGSPRSRERRHLPIYCRPSCFPHDCGGRSVALLVRLRDATCCAISTAYLSHSSVILNNHCAPGPPVTSIRIAPGSRPAMKLNTESTVTVRIRSAQRSSPG